MIDLDDLQRLAEGATPGPWEAYTDCPGECCWLIRQPEQDDAHTEGVTWPETSQADAAFIAAMSPDTAKKLIAVVRAAEEAYAFIADQGKAVFAHGGMPAVDQLNATALALRTALEELK